jgi:hypothetical protein
MLHVLRITSSNDIKVVLVHAIKEWQLPCWEIVIGQLTGGLVGEV